MNILQEGQIALRDALAAVSDEDLAGTTRVEGRSMRNADFFAMMIEHDLYHAGQVRYIRNLQEDLR